MEPSRCVMLFASLGVRHLTPMLELTKLFHRCSLAVTIAVPTVPSLALATMSVASEAVEWCCSQYTE
jgi:hypothetical protein